jgi:colanic acid biosynthesis glycosyl transferase WcaI
MADLHLVIQKANVSDLVMPSKLTTILAVGGVPIVTANKNSSLYNLVEKHQMGILVDAENQHALTTGIMQAVIEDNQYIRRNARNYAETNLSIDKVMLRFETSMMEKDMKLVSNI